MLGAEPHLGCSSKANGLAEPRPLLLVTTWCQSPTLPGQELSCTLVPGHLKTYSLGVSERRVVSGVVSGAVSGVWGGCGTAAILLPHPLIRSAAPALSPRTPHSTLTCKRTPGVTPPAPQTPALQSLGHEVLPGFPLPAEQQHQPRGASLRGHGAGRALGRGFPSPRGQPRGAARPPPAYAEGRRARNRAPMFPPASKQRQKRGENPAEKPSFPGPPGPLRQPP